MATLRTPPNPRPPKPVDPAKAVVAAPRLKPISTREYGKGGTPYSSFPNTSNYGAGIGYGGPRYGV
jgi:hypothetical protein